MAVLFRLNMKGRTLTEAAYIVDVVRTVGGRRKGMFASLHPADLGAASGEDRPSMWFSQKALHFAAQAVMSGTQDAVMAGGVAGSRLARGKKWGLQTMCEGGGVANATVVEVL